MSNNDLSEVKKALRSDYSLIEGGDRSNRGSLVLEIGDDEIFLSDSKAIIKEGRIGTWLMMQLK